MSAKEEHATVQDWVLTVLPLVPVAAAWFFRFSKLNISAFFQHNVWHITGICVGLFILRVFWHSFEKCERAENDLKAVKESVHQRILGAFLRHNTTDKLPLRVLLDCGVLDLKTEREASHLMAEIASRRGHDPFPDFVAVPDGKKLRALTLIRDRQIAIEDPQQMLDFLASINDIPRGKNLQ